MNETKKNSNAIGIDRIAIMTALNLADDLIKKDIHVSKITAEKNELSNQLNMQILLSIPYQIKLKMQWKSLKKRKRLLSEIEFGTSSLEAIIGSGSLECLPVDMSSTLYATPRRSFFMTYVHVRESERLCSYGDHRLEPPGSRAYPNSGILGNLIKKMKNDLRTALRKKRGNISPLRRSRDSKKNCLKYSE